jgi:hypothetical protein
MCAVRAGVGTYVAECACERNLKYKGAGGTMREIADSFMRLLAIIMVLITLAVSTAAVGLMFG